MRPADHQSSPSEAHRDEFGEWIRDLARRKRLMYCEGATGSEIEEFEQVFDVRCPEEYRSFLTHFGALKASNGVVIFGLGDTGGTEPSVEEVTFRVRMEQPFPNDLIPIEELGAGTFACLQCSGAKEGAVYETSAPTSKNSAALRIIAPSFQCYLTDRLRPWDVLNRHIEEYQKRFNYDHDRGGRLPRNHDWRPYRFCVQDVVFGSTVVRHSKEQNCLEVDVFLPAEVPDYDPLAGTLALTAFLLSEAFKCGGSMEIRFTQNAWNRGIPSSIRELASRSGLTFADSNRIAPRESKLLYFGLTGFPQELQSRILDLEASGKLNSVRACYVVHHGIWTREQVEMILLGSSLPDMVLSGAALANSWHLYNHCLLHARAALLAGGLDRCLGSHDQKATDGKAIELEDDLREIQIQFEAESYARFFQSKDSFIIPWIRGGRHVECPANTPFRVLIRARTEADMMRRLEGDLVLASKIAMETGDTAFVLLPSDFEALPAPVASQFAKRAESLGVELMISPDFVAALDAEASQKLARSRIIRQ